MNQSELARSMGISRQRLHQIQNPEKHRARELIKTMVSAGLMPRASSLKCRDCGNQAMDYDHLDYRKPTLVHPVCRTCHGKRGVLRRRKSMAGEAGKKPHWRQHARVNLYLPHEVVRLIDRQAKSNSMNRSSWIRVLAVNHDYRNGRQ